MNADDGALARAEPGDPDPGLALGIGQPHVPWTVLQRDRVYNALIAGGQNSGKCVGPDELVLLDGRLIRAEDAWEEYGAAAEWDGEGWWTTPLAQPLTNALADDGRIVTAPVTRLYRQHVREHGRRIRLSDGSELTTTYRHRLRRADGWTSEIAAGDVVCVPRRLHWLGRPLEPDLVELLAWQLAKGSERSQGGELSSEKRIPDFLMQGDLDAARTFLRAYAAADGHTAQSGQALELKPASRLLAEQLRVLLRRLAVLACLKPPRTRTRGTRTHHRLSIAGDSLRRFLAEIDTARQNEHRQVAGILSRENASALLDQAGDGTSSAPAPTALLEPVDADPTHALADEVDERPAREVFHLTVEQVEEVELDGFVYDFEVPEAHNFVAGGMLAHNTAFLLRWTLGDALAENTATVVLDMKGSLSERLLRLTPPDIGKRWWDGEAGGWRHDTKRLWYLDLGRPAFGLTPLRVDAGWSHIGLADEFARIADAITRALLDLYPGQIMGSSEDLIERAVVGTMAIAWFEHEQRCRRQGVDPTGRGFSGSFEVLAQMFAPTDRFDGEEAEGRDRRRVRPNRWHQAAGRACQRLPNLDQVADTLLYEIPRQARDNLADIAKRMEAPANKIRPLVGAAASVRRFVGHPERLSLRSVIEAHDTLVVNPRIELIGEDQASILANFIVHMLDLELKRQLAVPRSRRPRVSLVIDEAHRLITASLMTMVATHREAGLSTAAVVQYVSQLGADEPTAARREKILKGVGNLLQTKVLFRMSDSEDADRHSRIFRSVYETAVRADPTSRARMPFDPARMQTLADHHALVSTICSPDPNSDDPLADRSAGATRLPAFVTRTFRMPELEEIPDSWERRHLQRQAAVFRTYPEDMAALAVRDVPEGLADAAPAASDGGQARNDARHVAEQTIGRKPDGALRKQPPPAAPEEQQPAASGEHTAGAEPPQAASDAEPTAGRADGYDPELFAMASGADDERPGNRESEPSLFDPDSGRQRDGGDHAKAEPGAPGWEQVGGVRIERAEPRPQHQPQLVADSPVLRHACRPTRRPLPVGDAQPASEAAQQALRAAAALESISSLSDWRLAGDETIAKARAAAQQAREQALADAQSGRRSGDEAASLAERRARRAAQAALEPHGDAAWRTPVKELALSDADAHTLEVLARLHLGAPLLLAQLLEESPTERAIRKRLGRLHDAGLVARAEVGLEGRGRPPALYAVAPRGLEYLRLRRRELAPGQDPPRYLDADRKLPTPGRGSEVPHELAVHVALVALRQYGDGTLLHWHTARMPGGRWDVGMVHRNERDRSLRIADLMPAAGYSVHGEQLDAPAGLEPDLSVQLQGRVGGARATIDLLVEVDRTGRGAYNASKFAAYDQFLGGWCLRTRRFGQERGGRPLAVFVARRAGEIPPLVHTADRAMTLSFGAPGQYNRDTFDYPGRAHTAFTCIEWLLAGQAVALQLPPLPPSVRGSETELKPERVALLPEQWWRARRR